MQPFSIRSYPRAILHFDGDSFFASVEQAMNHRLRGKPVVTGGERGAATALSIEAKRLGLTRGMPMKQIRELCPEVIVVKSDYTAYSIYARRMYAIVRRYTPMVEEYSIDECFADITGLRGMYHRSYAQIGEMIKRELEESLGITFGVGLAPNKVVAKIASKHRKPGGFTAIPAKEVHTFLQNMPIGQVWGVGYSMQMALHKLGVTTALQFATKDEQWLRANKIAKPYREIWWELRGGFAKELSLTHNDDIGSIIKTRTFAPPTRERAFVLSQLSKNIESACAKARGHHMRPRAVSFFLKTQDFIYRTCELDLSVATNDPAVILRLVEAHFDRVFVPNILYRTTGITLRNLVEEGAATLDLFGEAQVVNERQPILTAVDSLNKKYGKETVILAASLKAVNHLEPNKQRNMTTRTSKVHLPLEQRKKTIDLPYLGRVR